MQYHGTYLRRIPCLARHQAKNSGRLHYNNRKCVIREKFCHCGNWFFFTENGKADNSNSTNSNNTSGPSQSNSNSSNSSNSNNQSNSQTNNQNNPVNVKQNVTVNYPDRDSDSYDNGYGDGYSDGRNSVKGTSASNGRAASGGTTSAGVLSPKTGASLPVLPIVAVFALAGIAVCGKKAHANR